MLPLPPVSALGNFPRAQCLQEIEWFSGLSPAARGYHSLLDAYEEGKVPLPHPVMFGFSEFG